MRPASYLSIHSLALTLLCLGTGGCGAIVGFAADPAASTTGDSEFKSPRDTVPSSDGSNFYFIATTPDNKPGVYSVAGGGGTVSQLSSGTLLVAPIGIALSPDDQTLYIADTSAGVFKLATRGGVPQLINGTATSHPRGLDVVASSGGDVIYFTGDDPATGQGSVFTVSASGGTVTTLAKGAPLMTPVGIVVDKGGTVYVSNLLAFAADAPSGSIVQIVRGVTTQLAGNLTLGYPAGLAINVSNTTLLASGLDAASGGHAQVYAIDLSSKILTTYNQGISANTGAGGVHRALNVDTFGWCGTTAGGGGTVYRIHL